MTVNIGQLAETIQRNCHVSDAIYAGNYSMCTFLLKMREYYRWENQIPLSGTLNKEAIGNWLVEREQSWNDIEEEKFEPVMINDASYDPFDSVPINQALMPYQLVYSAGYGVFGKPHFFLGHLLERKDFGDSAVYISSCEYARDLVAPPAMSLENNVFIRKESVRRFVWEKIEEWQWRKQPDTPLKKVLSNFNNHVEIESTLDKLTDAQSHIMLLHERGELAAEELLGKEWAAFVHSVAGSKAEFIARAVRDLIADMHVTLPKLLKNADNHEIHLYFADYSGIRKTLFPELRQAYDAMIQNQDKTALEETIQYGAKKWLAEGEQLLAYYKDLSEALEKKITAHYQDILS